LTVGPSGGFFTGQICDEAPLFLGPPGICVDQLEHPVGPVAHVKLFDVGRIAAGVGIAAATAKAWSMAQTCTADETRNGRGSAPFIVSGDGPVNVVQVHPASLAEWQKQIGIAILSHISHREFSEIEVRLQRDLNDPSYHRVGVIDYCGRSEKSHAVQYTD
jgi:hypothetical protein